MLTIEGNQVVGAVDIVAKYKVVGPEVLLSSFLSLVGRYENVVASRRVGIYKW